MTRSHRLLRVERGHLEHFGHRTPGYELVHPTPAGDPAAVLRAVNARRRAPADDHEGTRSGRTGCPVGSGRSRLPPPFRTPRTGPPGPAAAGHRARGHRVSPREESGPVTWTEPLALVRYAALEIGRRARSRGVLDAADDVFWLDDDEVRSVAVGGTPDRRLPAMRRHDAALTATTPPPPILGRNPGQPPIDDLPAPARWLNEGMIWLVGRMLEPSRLSTRAARGHDVIGVGAARGVGIGTVRVVHRDRDVGPG